MKMTTLQISPPEQSSGRKPRKPNQTTEVMCKVCLNVFMSGRKDAQYCNFRSACRVAAFRNRKKKAPNKPQE